MGYAELCFHLHIARAVGASRQASQDGAMELLAIRSVSIGVLLAIYSHETSCKGKNPFSRDGPIEAAIMSETSLQEIRSIIRTDFQDHWARPSPQFLHLLASLGRCLWLKKACCRLLQNKSAMLLPQVCCLATLTTVIPAIVDICMT